MKALCYLETSEAIRPKQSVGSRKIWIFRSVAIRPQK